jgi:hypothetical protein
VLDRRNPTMTTQNIALAAAAINATRTARGYVYRATETGRRYRVAARDMAALGAMLAAGQPDAYSEWCSTTAAVELAR